MIEETIIRKKDIKSMDRRELEQEISAMGEKKFRAGQIFSWLHEKGAMSFEEMTNLSKGLRETLSERYRIPAPKAVQVLISGEDGTRKYAFELEDGKSSRVC